MRCPKCSHSFKVTSEGAVSTDVAGGTLMASLGASNKRLYIKRPSGKIFGPFERNSIRTMLAANKLSKEATFSPDKVDWKSLNSFMEFAAFHIPEDHINGTIDPKSTQIGGWPSTDDLPAPKSSGAIAGVPPSLPTPKLPTMNSDLPGLPSLSGGSGLPLPPSGLPLPGLPVPASGLPVPSSGLPSLASGLPALSSGLPSLASALPAPASGLPALSSNLPGLQGTDLPASASSLPRPSFGVDLPAVPGTPGRTLNSGLLPLSDEDDLFGRDDDDDLFAESSSMLDASSEVNLFGSVAEEDDDEDLFGRSEPEEELQIQRNDDFLSDGENFSFLDEGKSTGNEQSDGWGEDLFEKSEVSPSHNADHVSEAFDDWGDDLLSDRHSSSAVVEPAIPADDPMRPRSRGIQSAQVDALSATTNKAATKDDDKKRGALSIVAVLAALAILGGVGWVVYSQFFRDTKEAIKPIAKKKQKKVQVAMEAIKSDNYDVLSKIATNTGKILPQKRGEFLLSQSLFLSRYENEKVFASAKKLALTLDSPKGDFEKLGRGAFEAVQGNASASQSYVSDLSGKDGAIGFYANTIIGIANIKSIANEIAKGPANHPEKKEKLDETPKEKIEAVEGEKTKKKGSEKSLEKGEKESEEKTEEKPQPEKKQSVSERFKQRREKASRALKNAAAIDKTSPLPGYWKGKLARLMGNKKAAQKAFAGKANLAHIPSLLEGGEIGVELGDLNEAISQLEKINAELLSAASPKELALSHYYAGLVHSGRNKSELAIENFIKSLSFDPGRADTLQKLAEEYERAKKFKEALNFFTTNKNLGKKSPDVMLGIVRSHIGLEQWISAITQLEDGQKEFPEDARFPSMLGRLYLKRGNFFDAQKPLERAVEIDPTLLDSHAMLAQLAWKTDKDVGKGETHIRKIVELPDFITARIAAQVAEYYRMSQRRSIAHDWFRESLKQDPNYWPARIAHARLLLEERNHKEARSLLEKARKEGVSDVRLSAYLADAYRQSKEYDRAIDEIKKVIAQFPNNEEYAFILGMIEFDRGNFETARKHFNHAYEINPKYHRAYFYVGRTLFAKNKSEDALRIFRHVLDNEPNKGEYRFYMARALEKAKRLTQALDEYRKATAIDKTYGIENPAIYVYRGKLLSRLGYAAEGKADIARALEFDPDNASALIAMANVNFNEKDYLASIANYNNALEKNPDQPKAQAKLGMSYLYSDKLRKAATHLQLAVKYGYKDPGVYKDLGYVYRDLGQPSLARDAFKKYLDQTKDLKIPSSTKREILDQIRTLK